MPSKRTVISNAYKSDNAVFSNQIAAITCPPIMNVARLWSDADGQNQEILPAVADLCYVIHGYKLMVRNDAGHTCSGGTIQFTDYDMYKDIMITHVLPVPSTANEVMDQLTGLNILTAPGKNITMSLAGAPAEATALIFYTEVRI